MKHKAAPKKNVLFVWRHNNDFDSTLPVIFTAAKNNSFDHIYIFVSSEELLWRNDFRISVLSELPNITIFDIWKLAGKLIGIPMRRLCETTRMTRGPLRKIFPRIARTIISHSAWRKQLLITIREIDPALIAFDWVDLSWDRPDQGPWGIKSIADWAKSNRRPVVGLMHGLSLASFPNGANSLSHDFNRLYIESEFRYKQMAEADFPQEKICVAGAPRFDKSWVDLLGKAIATQSLARRDHQAKTIVFFATKLVFDYDFERVIDWLDRVATMPGIRLIVQPHPRGQGKSSFRRLRRHPGCIIDMTTPAPILIREADIVSTLVSSVVCEAIVLGLPLLYPRFLNSLSTRFDEEGACIVVERMEDTEAAIRRCLEEKIPWEAYKRFLDRHVLGGQQSPITATLNDMLLIVGQ